MCGLMTALSLSHTHNTYTHTHTHTHCKTWAGVGTDGGTMMILMYCMWGSAVYATDVVENGLEAVEAAAVSF